MSKLSFRSSPRPTLGIELELAIVDESSMALSSSVNSILERVPENYRESVKPELMQCYLEINSKVCENVQEAKDDLSAKLYCVERLADELGLRLFWTGTHPFSSWGEQQVTPNERYNMLLNILQDMGRQLVTYGLHIHVGVDSGDKAVMICDRIMRHLPTLLALSCNSPWWEGRKTGLQSHRSKIMEALPTAGLPTLMRNWSEYTWLINHLVETGFINSIREIWWDVRPHHNFGTVEVRVCDMPGSLDDALAMAALVQCLVTALSEEIDGGTYQHDCHPMMVRQNKWRASRYGLDAELVDSFTFEPRPARDVVRSLVELLLPLGDALGCSNYLDHVNYMAEQPTWASRQLQLMEQTGDAAEVVRALARETQLS